MTAPEKISTKSGCDLYLERQVTGNTLKLSICLKTRQRCFLHWGLLHHRSAPWQIPPKHLWPEGSSAFDKFSLRTPFSGRNNSNPIIIRIDRALDADLIEFVLFFPEQNRWDNNAGRNYRIDIQRSAHPPPLSPSEKLKKVCQQAYSADSAITALAAKIIEKEMSRNSWTLMHRFNLCCELLDNACTSLDGLAHIFVWLRFSALRQLDWQRNYNTKPSELAHALDRLTVKLAGCYSAGTEQGELIRLILTTLGRGSEGQRVRDEVLNIMHRHHIKEVSGHFMEQWHQKLHNNTTPDDVVICEAYLAFLESNGNTDTFYKSLKKGGVSKKRLENYERPITTVPDFIPHLKDALIHDFRHFLGILKAVHTGTDLATAIQAARHLFDQAMHEATDFIWRHHEDPKMPLCRLVEKIVEARRYLAVLPAAGRSMPDKRDLLFLDIALEDFMRVAVERNLHLKLANEQLADLFTFVLESLCISHADDEWSCCLRHWQRLRQLPGFGKTWSLRAKAVLDRIEQVLSGFMDRYYELLQSKAEFLGSAFQAEPWTINLFSEETGRGRPLFILSMLLRRLNPVLRKVADLGNWQLISRGRGAGWIEVVPDLRTIQGKSFDRPTIVVADKVVGDEEIPAQVTAVITPDTTDIMSHVAIRARNARLLFATCYEPKIIGRLKSCSGRLMSLSVTPAGEVVVDEGDKKDLPAPVAILQGASPLTRTDFSVYAVAADDFNEPHVGAKSRALNRLRPLLPDWIHIPRSVALPFGVFGKVLADETNRQAKELYEILCRQVKENTEAVRGETLSALRTAVMSLNVPDVFFGFLGNVMDAEGLPRPASRDEAWSGIKRVWASKWNERAYLSRRAQGISHDDLLMAVLVQEVVKADYSFVIHTVNPLTGNSKELYAEVVIGLGETLVGNYPGRALSFIAKKDKSAPRIIAYPSKSKALFGGELIFRSDSNGEDLADYAGAGIYDSVILPQPCRRTLDYSQEPLLWDEQFQKDLLTTITRISTLVENAMETPQDIEGVVAADRYFVVQTRPQVGVGNE